MNDEAACKAAPPTDTTPDLTIAAQAASFADGSRDAGDPLAHAIGEFALRDEDDETLARPLRGSTKAVGLVLSTFWNADGFNAHPSVDTLARRSGFSRRTVQYALRELERYGFIVRNERGGGRWKCARYDAASRIRCKTCAVSRRKGCSYCSKGCNQRPKPCKERQKTAQPLHPNLILTLS